MSSSGEKKSTKNRAHALAAWEWFKEAAWLQVLLIVGVVVGLVVAIPFVVQTIVTAVNKSDSNFYEAHRIKFAQVEKYVAGEDKSCAGTVGKGTTSYSISDDEEGFVVMYYKQNDTDCDNLQSRIETWYNNFNKEYGQGNLKFYTVDCSWYPTDEDKSKEYEGDKTKYENSYITLEQQQLVMDSVRDVYLEQDDTHKSSSVTEETFNTRLDTGKDAKTLETPLFITYTRKKNTTKYSMNKVIFDMIGSYSNTSDTDVPKQMLDIYNLQITTKQTGISGLFFRGEL